MEKELPGCCNISFCIDYFVDSCARRLPKVAHFGLIFVLQTHGIYLKNKSSELDFFDHVGAEDFLLLKRRTCRQNFFLNRKASMLGHKRLTYIWVYCD
jgi:hypothetical protein